MCMYNCIIIHVGSTGDIPSQPATMTKSFQNFILQLFVTTTTQHVDTGTDDSVLGKGWFTNHHSGGTCL